MSVTHIRHVSGRRRPVPDVDRRVGYLARPYTVHEVGVVVPVFALSLKSYAIAAIVFLGIVTQSRLRFAGYHVRRAHQALDRAMRAQDAVANSVVFVAKGRLPGNDQIVWKI